LIQIRSSNDVALNGIKMMVYGAWGIGKTPLLTTAPGVIILSAEKGLLSIRNKNIPYIEINGYQSLIECYTWAAQSQEARQFYTIALDSLTEIAEVLLGELKRTNKDPRKAFYEVMDKTVEFTRAMRDLPGRNVILVAKEEFSKDVNGIQLFQPMMPGTKLGQALPYYFDEVFRMMAANDAAHTRYLCTQPSYQWMARDRSGMLGEYEPANLTTVFRKILGA
jgi:hypothetical protein